MTENTPSLTHEELQLQRVATLGILVIVAWLLASVFLVNIDFDDGYVTIVNSQYFLGISETYHWLRGPVLALLLTPAEWFSNWINLRPLDVRAHHVAMILLHSVYLIAVWRMLAQRYGHSVSVLMAFGAAVPSVVFFSYAPFISHDIFPGLLTAYMVKQAHDYMEEPSIRGLLLLIVVGTTLPLIKQSFAFVWIAIVLVHALLLPTSSSKTWRNFLILCFAAFISGAITWCVYATLLAQQFHDTHFLLRPTRLIAFVMGLHGESVHDVFYSWIYLRNFWAYGMAAMVLVVPGLYLSLKDGDSLQRQLALLWIVLVLIMHAIPQKEVRYLAFLAPITAFILAPVIKLAWNKRREYRLVIVGLLLIDLMHVVPEAARLYSPYYRRAATDFFEQLPTGEDQNTRLIIEQPVSFVSPEPGAFFADRFHRITHLMESSIAALYGFSPAQLRQIDTDVYLDIRTISPGDHLIMVTGMAIRLPPFTHAGQSVLDDAFFQALTIAEWVDLVRMDDTYLLIDNPEIPRILLPQEGEARTPTFGRIGFPVERLQRLLGLNEGPPRLRILGFRVLSACNPRGCEYFKSTSLSDGAKGGHFAPSN